MTEEKIYLPHCRYCGLPLEKGMLTGGSGLTAVCRNNECAIYNQHMLVNRLEITNDHNVKSAYDLEYDKDANVWVSRYKLLGIVSQGETPEHAIKSLESAIKASVNFWQKKANLVELSFQELRDSGVDLIDEHFPKGKCNERGSAIVLYALLIMRICEKYGINRK